MGRPPQERAEPWRKRRTTSTGLRDGAAQATPGAAVRRRAFGADIRNLEPIDLHVDRCPLGSDIWHFEAVKLQSVHAAEGNHQDRRTVAPRDRTARELG